jgi:subtilisin family serine protease
VVFNQQNDLPRDAEGIIAKAGGVITVRMAEIGAVGATSSDPAFASKIAGNPQVNEVGEDIQFQMIPDLNTLMGARDGADMPGPVEPTGPDRQPMPDNLGYEQWDKMRMNATLTGSYAVQQGRRDVVVAILDTGIDVIPTPHVDLAPNLDFARSRSFVSATGAALPSGDPNPAAWDDKHGHGSWCGSAVAAPINVVGISGVAPNVTLVALKVLGDNGSGSLLGLANALIYAGLNKFDVASMSLSAILRHADGYQALTKVVQRAVEFARSNGVLPIAALSNDNYDISDGSLFRDLLVVPAELAGVIGVSATGYYDQKAHYSNYGVGKTDVSAPGGATRNYTGVPGSGAAPGYRGEGRVLGAWSFEGIGSFMPVLREEECTTTTGAPPCSYYAWVQGTSMATPNAAGVAALIISTYGDFTADNSQKLHSPPTRIEAILQETANNRPCPEPRTVITDAAIPPTFEFTTATCSGDAGYNNFFGKGIVDALKAVTQGPSVASN